MHNHAPAEYRCPFCRDITSGDSVYPLEILHRYDEVFVKVNPMWWPNNPGSVLVIPIEHFENVYDLPVSLGAPLQQAVRDSALAMKTAFGCDGISTRQHNEPAGNQDVWHYHIHVFPRYEGDRLYHTDRQPAPEQELQDRARQLRDAWPA